MVNKSQLQKMLEESGWEFLTTEDPTRSSETHTDDIFAEETIVDSATHDFIAAVYSGASYGDRNMLDQALKEEYLERGFKDVLIADATDAQDKLIPGLRAVYVKRHDEQ